MKSPLIAFAAMAAFTLATCAQEWRPLFNGRDLEGWVPVNVASNTFTVRDGIIISTGKPTGVMRTDRQYENFELELEWKHIEKGGNAGLFVWSDPITAPGVPFTRSIEVQILDGRNSESYTSHGDVFSIHGARMKPDRPHPRGAERCLPSEFRAKPAGEWNQYRVVCRDGDLKLAVNGKVVSGGSGCVPRKGYICLEAEGTECHFRNIRIKELPSSNPPPEQTASLADGFVSVYNGLDLQGWTSKGKEHWKPTDWILAYDGKAAGNDLWFDRPLGDFEMIVDWRVTAKDVNPAAAFVFESVDGHARDELASRGNGKPGQWNRSVIRVAGNEITLSHGSSMVRNSRDGGPANTQRRIGLQARSHPVEFANIYIKELK